MAKGATAKTNVIKKIYEAFGDDYIGEVDKKVYVWADDGGEKVQIALAMTCPKNPIEVPGANEPVFVDNSGGHNFDEPAASPVVSTARAEVTEEEKQKIAEMMERFGL